MGHDDNRSLLLTLFVFFGTVIIVIMAITTGACNNDAEAHRALDNSGFSDINLRGYAFWGCGESEVGTKFQAKNPKGNYVEGVVCCGVVKSCTVRFLWTASRTLFSGCGGTKVSSFWPSGALRG